MNKEEFLSHLSTLLPEGDYLVKNIQFEPGKSDTWYDSFTPVLHTMHSFQEQDIVVELSCIRTKNQEVVGRLV